MKEDAIKQSERIFVNYLKDLPRHYNEMKDEGLSYWSLSSSFVDVLFYGNYFESNNNLNEIIDLGFQYFNYYQITDDPWYKKGELFFYKTFLWKKYIFYRFLGEKHEDIGDQFYEKLLEYYKLKKIYKTDAADWENFIFISWFLKKPFNDAININKICNRKLLGIFIDFEFNKNIATDLLLSNYRKEFNRNRNNILFNVENGIPQIFYYFYNFGITPSIKDICKAQFEGLH